MRSYISDYDTNFLKAKTMVISASGDAISDIFLITMPSYSYCFQIIIHRSPKMEGKWNPERYNNLTGNISLLTE